MGKGLIGRIGRRGIFARLNMHETAALFSSADLLRVGAGTELIRQGDTRRDYLVLLDGELEVRRSWTAADGHAETSVGRVRPGEGVGEMSVLSSLPRGATVTAVLPSRLLRLDGERMDELLSWCPPLGDRLKADAEERERMNAVRQSSAFRQLPLATMQCAFERMEPLDVAAGGVVVREGEPGDAYFLVESGRADVLAGGVAVAVLGPGSTFGEEALLTGAPRNATVAMRDAGRLWRLSKTDFEESVRAALVEEIAPERALEMVARGAVWIDCRVEEEFAAGRIPGATLLPLNRLRREAGGLEPDRQYVVYCRNGVRSGCAAFLLRERGIAAYSLAGGLGEWPYEIDAGPASP